MGSDAALTPPPIGTPKVSKGYIRTTQTCRGSGGIALSFQILGRTGLQDHEGSRISNLNTAPFQRLFKKSPYYIPRAVKMKTFMLIHASPTLNVIPPRPT